MSISVKAVAEAFGEIYCELLSSHFRRRNRLKKLGGLNERAISNTVLAKLEERFHGRVEAEVDTLLPGSNSAGKPYATTGKGRLDFKVGTVGVEFAVRHNAGPAASLSHVVNTTEIIKLSKYEEGRALLVLYDFTDGQLSRAQLTRFRERPSLGRGNHNRFPFTIAYFYRDPGQPGGVGNCLIRVR